jgi:hypothetical protein
MITSVESEYSRNLYSLNAELLDKRQKLATIEANRCSLKNIRVLFSYLRSGAFNRIIRRFSLLRTTTVSPTVSYKLKNYSSFPNCKIVVYTCIWGKYDEIIEPYYINNNIDYYIITDQELPETSKWKKIDIRNLIDIHNMSPIEVNRFCKMLPHKLFDQYEYSIYIDGNIRIITDMMPIIADMNDSLIGIHDYHVDCIYNMKNAVIAGKKAKRADVDSQIEKYRSDGFPKHFGAFECNILVRKHMNAECIQIMEAWWREFNDTKSKRDQLSLPYVLWKYGKDKSFIHSLGNNVFLNPRFQIGRHI